MNDDLEQLALRKTLAIMRAHPWMAPEALIDQVIRIRYDSGSYEGKKLKFIRLADRFHKAVAPHTACRSRCSACCHLPTMLYACEASALANASGRTMATLPPREPSLSLAAAKQYFGKPCPFLKQDRCSVYEVRPVICRLHHSLNAGPEACNTSLPPEQRRVASYDVDLVEGPYHAFVREEAPLEPWGCIHEFFPTNPA
ncbi:Flagellin N-methylase [Azoarcus sp. Aa7]|nr:Flagellin N-methylase [Azoarcus sp. Aa7]